jgi:hypothetical protein
MSTSIPRHNQIDRDRYLRSLALRPSDALRKWKRLRRREDLIVLRYMTLYYGVNFATRFREETVRTKHPDDVAEITSSSPATQQQLQAVGCKFLGTFPSLLGDVQVWGRPTGREVWVLPPPKGQPLLATLPEDPGVAEARAYADDFSAAKDQLAKQLLVLRNSIGKPEYARLYHQHLDHSNKWLADLALLLDQRIPSLREEVVEVRDQQSLEQEVKRLEGLLDWKENEWSLAMQALPPP